MKLRLSEQVREDIERIETYWSQNRPKHVEALDEVGRIIENLQLPLAP